MTPNGFILLTCLAISSCFDVTVTTHEELVIELEKFRAFCKRQQQVRSIVWDPEVADNEHSNKLRTDNEYWDGRR